MSERFEGLSSKNHDSGHEISRTGSSQRPLRIITDTTQAGTASEAESPKEKILSQKEAMKRISEFDWRGQTELNEHNISTGGPAFQRAMGIEVIRSPSRQQGGEYTKSFSSASEDASVSKDKNSATEQTPQPEHTINEARLISEFKSRKIYIIDIRDTANQKYKRYSKSGKNALARIYEDLRDASNKFLLSHDLVSHPAARSRMTKSYPNTWKTHSPDYAYQLKDAMEAKKNNVNDHQEDKPLNTKINALLELYESCKQPR